MQLHVGFAGTHQSCPMSGAAGHPDEQRRAGEAHRRVAAGSGHAAVSPPFPQVIKQSNPICPFARFLLCCLFHAGEYPVLGEHSAAPLPGITTASRRQHDCERGVCHPRTD